MPFSVSNLETTFRDIQASRMEGVPLINENLSVKAIHFQEWNSYQLGILITPWFMNLMLVPFNDIDSIQKIGTTHQYIFPSGSYEFVAGHEEKIGHYLSCSLFSPMFEFDSQEAAELTASEALKAIMNEENLDASSQNPASEIEQIWKGETPDPEKTHNFDGSEIKKAPARKKLTEKLKEPTSRRDFLRGNAFRKDLDDTPGSNQS